MPFSVEVLHSNRSLCALLATFHMHEFCTIFHQKVVVVQVVVIQTGPVGKHGNDLSLEETSSFKTTKH